MLSILPWSVPNKQTWKQPISQDSKIWQVGYIALIEKKFGEELLLPEGNDEDGEMCAAVEAQHLFLGHVDIVSEIIFFFIIVFSLTIIKNKHLENSKANA